MKYIDLLSSKKWHYIIEYFSLSIFLLYGIGHVLNIKCLTTVNFKYFLCFIVGVYFGYLITEVKNKRRVN